MCREKLPHPFSITVFLSFFQSIQLIEAALFFVARIMGLVMGIYTENDTDNRKRIEEGLENEKQLKGVDENVSSFGVRCCWGCLQFLGFYL